MRPDKSLVEDRPCESYLLLGADADASWCIRAIPARDRRGGSQDRRVAATSATGANLGADADPLVRLFELSTATVPLAGNTSRTMMLAMGRYHRTRRRGESPYC
jgi:hypothetical protein